MNADDGTDADLLRRLAGGDAHALSIVFDRHAPAVTRYAWRLSDSRQNVEEIVQDTFVTAWRRAGEITLPDASILPWLLVTCRNLAFNANRKAARSQADTLPDEGWNELVVFGGADRDTEDARDRLRWVLDEIARLDPIDRQVCELCLVQGLPYAEAARELRITVGAVKQRVSRSRVRLRKAVTSDEF